MPIEEWLGNLGLGECASRFVENAIDFEILGDLTDQDLEKIGGRFTWSPSKAAKSHFRTECFAGGNSLGCETADLAAG